MGIVDKMWGGVKSAPGLVGNWLGGKLSFEKKGPLFEMFQRVSEDNYVIANVPRVKFGGDGESVFSALRNYYEVLKDDPTIDKEEFAKNNLKSSNNRNAFLKVLATQKSLKARYYDTDSEAREASADFFVVDFHFTGKQESGRCLEIKIDKTLSYADAREVLVASLLAIKGVEGLTQEEEKLVDRMLGQFQWGQKREKLQEVNVGVEGDEKTPAVTVHIDDEDSQTKSSHRDAAERRSNDSTRSR